MTKPQQAQPKNKRPNPTKADKSAHVMQEQSQRDNSDVLGSYTGTPTDGGQPVQDQDDL